MLSMEMAGKSRNWEEAQLEPRAYQRHPGCWNCVLLVSQQSIVPQILPVPSLDLLRSWKFGWEERDNQIFGGRSHSETPGSSTQFHIISVISPWAFEDVKFRVFRIFSNFDGQASQTPASPSENEVQAHISNLDRDGVITRLWWLVIEADVEEPEQPLPKRAKRKTQERFGLWCYTRKTKGDFAYKQHLQEMFDTAHPVSHVAHIDNINACLTEFDMYTDIIGMVVGHYGTSMSSMANCQTSSGFQWFHPRRNEMQLKVGKCGLVSIVF